MKLLDKILGRSGALETEAIPTAEDANPVVEETPALEEEAHVEDGATADEAGTEHAEEENKPDEIPAMNLGGKTPSNKYPELRDIVDETYDLVEKHINKRIKEVDSKMQYKAQWVLEELIKDLQKAV